MYDFHSHVLPGIDDGAKNVTESMAILKMAYAQGIRTILATPHYYSEKMSIQSFLEERSRSFALLEEEIQNTEEPLPKVVLGAEVHLSSQLLMRKEVPLLCIENTNFLLTELPFSGISDHVYRWIFDLIADKGVIPILAHIERYIYKKTDYEKVNKLLQMNVYTQINAGSYLKLKNQRIINKLIRNNAVHLLGSDCHNVGNRSYYLEKACAKLEKKFGKTFVHQVNNHARIILSGEYPAKSQQ